MRTKKFLFLLFLTCFLLSCEKRLAEQDSLSIESSRNFSYSKIEDVDFKNFSYFHGENDNYKLTLTNGEKPYGQMEDITFRLRTIQYADLTADNKNEAIINLFVGYGGSGTTSLIFIYTLVDGQPKKLWEISSGYNADGGLKNIYPKENSLSIEFFGNTKFDENKGEFEFPKNSKYPELLCCPKNFTKFDFEWNGEKFVLENKPQVLGYDWKSEKNENLSYPVN